ncbi:MAG: DUF58 domain-containing protein [Anaerolineales bacterium]|nr:MAG: DUF58 domain-containing protein [Anaerolineales bacterium]
MIADYDLDLLSHLHFVAHKRRRTGHWGERRSTHRGEGLEFTDYRDYSPGDDPRSVDWNLYARLDRPYVRLYEEEEELVTAVLIDGSGSMNWEGETFSKWSAVQHLAVAFGGIALLHGDVLQGSLLQSGDAPGVWGPYRGRGYFMLWQKWVNTLTPRSDATIAGTLTAFAIRATRPALVLLLTDGYDSDGLASGTAALTAHGHEVVVLHILTTDELDPVFRGDLRLIETETGKRQEITIDAVALAAYHQKLEQWCRNLRTNCAKHGGRYALLRADLPLRQLLLEDLRHSDVLR